MSIAIALHEVTKTFGDTLAVDRLDLSVAEGSIYGFIGPNGSGKTTTLRLILRIFQPDSGRVVVLDDESRVVADDRLGYLPEERGLYKRMKVGDVIEYFARLKGFFNCRNSIAEWLERLDAAGWAGRRMDSLSKGMAQKIQFIVAVIAKPRILVLDEPFAGLDPVNFELLKDAVISLRSAGTTVILSTHDMHVAEGMCDTIFMIFQGRKVLDGSLAEIQRKYPVNRVRVRLANGQHVPSDLAGMTMGAQVAGFQELNLQESASPHTVLRQLAAARDVEHFEIMRPSLHDIFVDIAKPPSGSNGK